MAFGVQPPPVDDADAAVSRLVNEPSHSLNRVGGCPAMQVQSFAWGVFAALQPPDRASVHSRCREVGVGRLVTHLDGGRRWGRRGGPHADGSNVPNAPAWIWREADHIGHGEREALDVGIRREGLVFRAGVLRFGPLPHMEILRPPRMAFSGGAVSSPVAARQGGRCPRASRRIGHRRHRKIASEIPFEGG